MDSPTPLISDLACTDRSDWAAWRSSPTSANRLQISYRSVGLRENITRVGISVHLLQLTLPPVRLQPQELQLHVTGTAAQPSSGCHTSTAVESLQNTTLSSKPRSLANDANPSASAASFERFVILSLRRRRRLLHGRPRYPTTARRFLVLKPAQKLSTAASTASGSSCLGVVPDHSFCLDQVPCDLLVPRN